MRRYLPALLLAGLVLTVPAIADDPPAAAPVPAGNWKVLLPAVRESQGKAVWLIKLESKDKGWTATVLGTAERWPKAEVQSVKEGKDSLQLTIKAGMLTLPCDIRLTKAADKLYGSATLRANPTPVELERTSLTSLDPFELDKEELSKKPLGFDTMGLALNLLGQSVEKKAKPADVRSWAEKAVKSAELYAPAWQRSIVLIVAQILSDQKGFEPLGLQYAQRAERMLEAKEPPVAQEKVLSVLATALEKAGKKEEAEQVQARVKKLDFRIKPKAYAGRKGKSNRTVLAEVFTTAESEQSVAVDQALESLARTFKPTDLVVLRYHLHAPKPDALAGEESEVRARFYDEVLRRQLPALLLDGKTAQPGGGTRVDAQEKYDDYFEALSPLLETPAGAEVKVQAARKGDKVTISAEVPKASAAGDDVRLRLALTEEEVAFKGSSGTAVHQNVVRALPGGDEGTPVKDKDKGLKKTFTVDLGELRKKRKEYLDKYAAKRPFPSKEQPFELKKLKVVAFVQNDKTGEVLQTAQAEVKEESKEK